MYVFERTDGQATPDGPNGDVSGVGSYIYLASSEESNGNGTARLLSPVASSDMVTVCFEFWYYMNGEHVDNLQILLETGTDAQSLWQRKSEQGMKWIFGEVTLDLQKGQRLVTQASLITESNGLIALDDFVVTAGTCPARHTLDVNTPTMFLPCDFEQSNCGWHADSSSTTLYDWLVSSGSNLVAPDAPLSDHTLSNQSGHYVTDFNFVPCIFCIPVIYSFSLPFTQQVPTPTITMQVLKQGQLVISIPHQTAIVW